MSRRAALMASFSLAISFACESGRLDTFTGIARGGQGGSGTGGAPPGGTSSGGTHVAGGEGGEGATPDLLLVDDFEDGNQIALVQQGEWYVANDGTGVQTFAVERPPERPGSNFAAHTSGVGFVTWGAIFGLDLAGSRSAFDASEYAALTFSAKAEPGSTRTILFAFLVGSQHFAVPLELGTDWEIHTIPFTDALPAEDGPLPSFDPRAIAGIQFFMGRNVSFDFWLDDLAFVK